MARVLFAWELGGGFGHAGPLRAVADRLSADGHEPVFALRDVVTPAPLFRDRRYPVFQAPFWPKPFALRGRTHALSSYSDLLALSGYGQAADLAAMVAAWDTMIDQVRPDLVVLDNAPTLALAVYDRVPAIFTGYGFTLPPAHDGRFPILRDETPLLMAESQLLRNVESVQRGRSATVPETLTALFRGRFRALTCVRELDPYIARRDPELGPLEPMPVLTPLPAEAVLFAYLGGEFRNLDSVVQALSLLRCKVRAFLRDDAAMHASFLASRGVHVFRDAPALATVVPQSTWVLSMAGHTTAHAALMGGRGQIVAPTHLETSMTAERLIKLGVAREYDPRGEPHEIADALAGIVADEGPLEAAASAAAAIADRHLGSGLERLIAACREALA